MTGQKGLTMMLQVMYTLSEQGRKEALRRGLPATHKQVLGGEINAEALDIPGVYVDAEGHAILTSYPHSYILDSAEFVGRATLDERDTPLVDVGEALDVVRAAVAAESAKLAVREAEERAKVDTAVATALATGPESFVRTRYDSWETTGWVDGVDIGDDPRVEQLVAQAHEIVKIHRAEIEAQEERNAAAERAADAKKAQQLTDAVMQLGSSSQRERWAAGVMPRREAIDLITANARRPLTDAGLVVEDSDSYHVDGDSTSEARIKNLDDEKWSVVKSIFTALPSLDREKVDFWRQTGIDTDSGEKHVRILARLSWTVGLIDIDTDVIINEYRVSAEEADQD